jgi:peptide deformylase
LRKKSAEVKKFDSELKRLVKNMKDTLKAVKGLGLAAPQVGTNVRVFVMVLNYEKKDAKVIAMVNPVILGKSETTLIAEEGCLSIPGVFKNVERFESVVVEFLDEEGIRQVLTVEGLNAREVQHENDHLDGVLFVDRVKEMQKEK